MANQFPLQGVGGLTDADGNIAQHIEYIPYGEIFVEERNNSFSTNYLFNAKELDNETGLYYYGARYLDPTGAMWLSVDPMWEKNVGASPYNYCQTGDPVLQGIDGVKGYELLGYELDNTKGVQKNSVSGHRGTDITTLFGGKSLPGIKSIGGNNVLDISSNGSELLWIAAPQKNNPWLQKDKNGKTRILNRLGF